MDMNSMKLTIMYMNIQGQSNLSTNKQLQIEDILKNKKVDILHLQEVEINSDTFECCNFICSNYNIIPNNSENKYGTATLIKCGIDYKNLRCDTLGRAIVFDVDDLTFGNIYGHSGTDGHTRNNRESF